MICIKLGKKEFKGEEEIKAKASEDLGREVSMDEVMDFELEYELWQGYESEIKARSERGFWREYWGLEK